ncbi:MAG: RNHCP domain-containing protein [Clostridiales bacterium]|jgi:DNA-directed RNA polymerase subunit RPC12/RpoP|nr:RNHCP domain-containing protein [Clostridiales bacterium]
MARKTENTGFVCINCGADVPPIASGTIRNHCPGCLCSLHVDMDIGDRLCDCRGLMRPRAIEYHSQKGWQIFHRCVACGFERKNMTADDDNLDEILKIMRNSAF